MTANTQRASRLGGILIFFLVLLGVLMGPTWYFSRGRSHEYPHPGMNQWKQLLGEAKVAGGTPRVLLVGDSRVHAGLDPFVLGNEGLAEGHGESVFNLGVDGTDALHQSSLLRQILDQPESQTLDLVVWAIQPLSFHGGRTQNRLHYYSAYDVLEWARQRAPLEMILDGITQSWLSPWRDRPLAQERVSATKEILGIKAAPLQSRILGYMPPFEPPSRNYQRLPGGYEPFEVLEWSSRFSRGMASYEAEWHGFHVAHWAMASLMGRVDQMLQRGIRVVLLELPVAPSLEEMESADPSRFQAVSAWRNQLKDFVSARSLRGGGGMDAKERPSEPHLAYWDDRAWTEPGRFRVPWVYGDPGHMPRGLSQKYSRALAWRLSHWRMASPGEGEQVGGL